MVDGHIAFFDKEAVLGLTLVLEKKDKIVINFSDFFFKLHIVSLTMQYQC